MKSIDGGGKTNDSVSGNGVGEDTAVGVRGAIPEMYCGCGDDLINVPGNLKMPSLDELRRHERQSAPKQQRHP